MNTHKNMRAYTHTQTLIHTGIHTNICTRTCMRTHALSYTHTLKRTLTHMRMDVQWAPLLYTHCSPVKSKGATGTVQTWFVSTKVQQAVFVGGTCGSVHVESFNRNIK